MRTLHIWFPIVFLSMVHAITNTDIVRFTENVVLENYISNNHAISETVCSLAKCGVICALQDRCASFSYCNTTMKCKTYSVVFSSSAGLLYSPGTIIYNPQRDWPSGTFALPKTQEGCPKNGEWEEGWRYQDTDNEGNSNNWSSPIMLAGTFDNNGIRLEYCVKITTLPTEQTSWPQGKYCILKKFDCPLGFHSHSIEWDDENANNKNDKGGTLPEGQYNANTLVYFCCRSDGNDAYLSLPTESPFYLLPHLPTAASACPAVVGMNGESHFVYFDNEVGRITLYFCYYKPM